jgi:hypothetical protein
MAKDEKAVTIFFKEALSLFSSTFIRVQSFTTSSDQTGRIRNSVEEPRLGMRLGEMGLDLVVRDQDAGGDSPAMRS